VPNENGTAKATDRISNKIKVCFSWVGLMTPGMATSRNRV
jgi:hypothetical protein